MCSISDETEKWLQLAQIASLSELLGLSGNLKFPRPTFEEIWQLQNAPERLLPERKIVLEAYENRLTHNKAAEDLYLARQQALDKKAKRLLRKT